MTSQYNRAPSSDRLKTYQNRLFEDVCGEVFCNHFQIYTHVDRQAAIICVKFQIDDVIRGHLALKVHFLKWNNSNVMMRSSWNSVGSCELWNDIVMTSSDDFLWFFFSIFTPLSHKLLTEHGIIWIILLFMLDWANCFEYTNTFKFSRAIMSSLL